MTENKKPTFGQFLAECRLKKGLTQKQVADILIVEESTISKWEKDKRRPDIEFVSKLSEIFEITESELINASIDNSRIKDKKQAKKYRAIVTTYNMIHFIAFGVALLACFIVNLATAGTLSWFFIVLFAIICYGAHSMLPQYIKKHKLLFIPLISLSSICMLILVCSIFTGGWWFIIPFAALILFYSLIFTPIIIHNYGHAFLKKHNEVFTIAIDAVLLFILLIVINAYISLTGSGAFGWCFSAGLPILLFWLIPIMGTVAISVYTKINGFIKTSINIVLWLTISNVFYLFLPLLNIAPNNQGMFWEANFSNWAGETISANVMLIVCIVALVLAVVFAGLGFAFLNKKKKLNKIKT